ncbi:MAG: hypothetical protein EA382_14240, partial [Spirochaetaceae bacterium]
MYLNFGPPHNQTGGSHYVKGGPKHQYAAPEADEAIYRDPNLPKFHPAATAEDYLRAAPGYFGCVTAVDRAFGRLIAELDDQGLCEQTIVVFTADHGEMLGIQGRWMKDIWYEESIGIPCIARRPGRIPAGRRDETLFGLVDLMPTITSLAGIAVEPGRHGRDLSAHWRDNEEAESQTQLLAFNTGAPPPELSKHPFPDESGRYWRGIRTPTHVYVVLDQREQSERYFYDPAQVRHAFPPHATRAAWDLADDPRQLRPIYPGAGNDALLDRLHDELARQLEA